MVGREDKKENDLFYLCSLIEYIARKTANRPAWVVHHLGPINLRKIYELADVYHSDNIEDVSDTFVRKCQIERGNFENLSGCMYAIPSYWDMGKVYKRLILTIAKQENTDVLTALERLFASPIVDRIENYNSDMYYQSADTLFQIYSEGLMDGN